MKLIGVVGSGSTTTYSPVIIYEREEGEAKEECLVVIDDSFRGLRFLGILRFIKRYEPFLNPWQRTSYVDKPSLVDSGTYPHSAAYVYIIGVLRSDGGIGPNELPPNPGSKVFIVTSPEDVRVDLGEGLVVGAHKHSGVEIPVNPGSLRLHIAVVGATGMGKSRLVKALIDEVLSKTEWSVLVFDHSGMDYVQFYRDYVVPGSSIALDPATISESIVRSSNLDKHHVDYVAAAVTIYMSCLSGEGVGNACAGVRSACYGAGEGVHAHTLRGQGLAQSIVKVFESANIGDLTAAAARSRLGWDRECFKRVVLAVARAFCAKPSTLLKLSAATDLWLGDPFFNRLSGRSILPRDVVKEALSRRIAVIDLSTEDMFVRRYVVATVLKNLWDLVGSSRSEVNTLVVIDEAHNYACRYCQPSSEVIVRTAREGRKWGLGLLLATQRAIDIDTEVRNNINTVFFSKLQTPSDFEQIGSFISLAGVKEETLAVLNRREFFLAGLGNPLKIPILIKVREVG